MPEFSIIIPVYNRPDELKELLDSLTRQRYRDFEVLVVEDGSTIRADSVVSSYQEELNIYYFYKENEGQGFARNYGYSRACGSFYIVFDSDCLIPPHYLQTVSDFLKNHKVDAFGGPDAAHPSFTIVQKAISHVMTSFFTTGGIRGRKTHIGQFHPRSFNMGISSSVYDQTHGYRIPFMGEDLEFSTRILKAGFKTALIAEAFVYHKRRLSLSKFYKQLRFFGRARINLSRFHPEQIRLIHTFPVIFTTGLLLSVVLSLLGYSTGVFGIGLYGLFFVLIAVEGAIKSSSISVAILTPFVACVQQVAYAHGLVQEWVRKLRGIDPNTPYIELYD